MTTNNATEIRKPDQEGQAQVKGGVDAAASIHISSKPPRFMLSLVVGAAGEGDRYGDVLTESEFDLVTMIERGDTALRFDLTADQRIAAWRHLIAAAESRIAKLQWSKDHAERKTEKT